jgi:hypothetical protein
MSTADVEADDRGLAIRPISDDEFRGFARRFGKSPEVGPIATCLDRDARPNPDARRYVTGLFGCGRLCAAACFELYWSRVDAGSQVLKLDSVIVDPELRRRGLGALIVTQAFLDLLTDPELNVTRIYAHSVHPATVLLLRRLAFADPPVTGAPISQVSIEPEDRAALTRGWESRVRDQRAQKKLVCESCRINSRRARPWCLTPGP